jgi:hypothetical protein
MTNGPKSGPDPKGFHHAAAAVEGFAAAALLFGAQGRAELWQTGCNPRQNAENPADLVRMMYNFDKVPRTIEMWQSTYYNHKKGCRYAENRAYSDL